MWHFMVNHCRRKRASGFTVIELMITMAIAVILLGVALPSFSSFINKVKLNSLSSSLVSTLREARSEAIKRNARVLVCASNTTGTDCTSSTAWGNTGWIACYDLDADGSCDATTTSLPNPIRHENAVPAGFATVTGPATAIRFNPTGSQGATGGSTITIAVSGQWTGAATSNVTVAATGLIKGERQ